MLPCAAFSTNQLRSSRTRKLTKLLVFACAATTIGTYHGPISAHAADKGVLTSVFLGDLEGQANSVIDNARNSGDFLIWRAAEQAKAVIAAWKEANSALLDKAFDGLSTANKDLFDNIDTSIGQMGKQRELAVADAQKLTNQWATVVKNLPFTNKDAEIAQYSPRVLAPMGESIIPIKLNGPKLAGAKATMTSPDGKSIPVAATIDTELLAKIDRSQVKFDDTKSGFATYKLEFIKKAGGLLSAEEKSKRDIVIWLAPKVIATYSVNTKVNKSDKIPDTWSKDMGGKGKDSAYPVSITLPPDYKAAGWKIDTTRLRSNLNPVADLGGDHGSCEGVRQDTISEDGFVYNIQLGHRTGSFGKKSDAWQNCRIAVPIYRINKSIVDGPTLNGDVFWNDDRKVDMPENVASKTVSVKLFNGRTHLIDAKRSALGILSVEDRGASLILKPTPPNDF